MSMPRADFSRRLSTDRRREPARKLRVEFTSARCQKVKHQLQTRRYRSSSGATFGRECSAANPPTGSRRLAVDYHRMHTTPASLSLQGLGTPCVSIAALPRHDQAGISSSSFWCARVSQRTYSTHRPLMHHEDCGLSLVMHGQCRLTGLFAISDVREELQGRFADVFYLFPLSFRSVDRTTCRNKNSP